MDKTIDDKLIYISNEIEKNYQFCDYLFTTLNNDNLNQPKSFSNEWEIDLFLYKT